MPLPEAFTLTAADRKLHHDQASGDPGIVLVPDVNMPYPRTRALGIKPGIVRMVKFDSDNG